MALLALAHPPVVVFTQDVMATRDIVRGRKTYTDFSEVNRFQDSKDAFFAGVQYAFDNLAPAEAGVPALTCVEFHDYVDAELGTKTVSEKEVEQNHAELGADGSAEAITTAGQIVEMANTGHIGMVGDVGRSAAQVVGRSFWKVI
ncbi:hypothetical protein A1F97_11027 [Pyrenophora tritici-repentis]|uniref:Uncharacterized protein n=2 Tax=Pyrenophora tritici-repentis TaxID=45151 RepID=A0A2W1FJG5_9PLEO|nr:uncharacterized protein PTRG_03154 [Pyrenophora tritici-repentis Pt-1C-BFP]KAF7575141.1 hypothetical protein PtrM4_067650 [Pyrenophora tritici-repentis]EDU45677.1 predicted protein [Pyrenophora tritici-repentis Pt-1C-BFP]KAI0569313.1 hypothetical protein Alg215_11713 [Pyrenophora tritici-repentis]KAI0604181.1 hypothetical protein TUN205_11572 [Pyrenophora tritici-repentis]KAI1515108.1 hypothetical protein Ptr86124_006431 [Pyrenophora tritici-repentis]